MITPVLRVLLVLASLLLLATFWVPVWRIDLFAPQYPEGLQMNIWLTHLSGNIDSINGLNHYIGMRIIEEKMFPEFRILPYVVGALVAWGLLAAAVARRWLVGTWLTGLLVFLAAAMVDFYRWGYDYGHNLDPHAAIKLEGMTYQPPLIGYKQLLNFEAYSLPDVGAWFIGAAAGLAALVIWRSAARYSKAAKEPWACPLHGRRKVLSS
ncbi:hypothetical protein [Hymenobacter sp. DG25B]|uniref:hypothetical protein n=1 Tax=Hymenobacter sp. DG25B TaxID=1385664 RepID=UPI00081418B0|nr:hypothetical protein [Hymenobacter sp. DG25B]